jgi:RNA polymerase sigma factor (sigma-70 family)
MKDLEVTVIVRNNRLKERRLALGMNQRLLALAAGVSPQAYAKLEQLRASAVKDGDWSATARGLATFYEVEPEELFPESLQEIREDRVVRRVDLDEVRSLPAPDVLPGLPAGSYDVEGAAAELRKRVLEVVGSLTEREQTILKARFGLGALPAQTLSQVGKTIGRSAGRVGQIEARALRKLRHPSRATQLRRFIDFIPQYEDAASERAERAYERAREQARVCETDNYDDLFLACDLCGTGVQVWPPANDWQALLKVWLLAEVGKSRKATIDFLTKSGNYACGRCRGDLVFRQRDKTVLCTYLSGVATTRAG